MATIPSIRSIIWASAPLLVLMGWFIFVALVNWEYEAKFFRLLPIEENLDSWIGPKLLIAAITFGAASSAFAFLAARQKLSKRWLQFWLSLLVSSLLFFMALGFLLLGPAAVTMMEQMRLLKS